MQKNKECIICSNRFHDCGCADWPCSEGFCSEKCFEISGHPGSKTSFSCSEIDWWDNISDCKFCNEEYDEMIELFKNEIKKYK